MSRATRPRRCLRLGWSLALLVLVPQAASMVDLRHGSWARRQAQRLGTRAAILRRCLLGCPVSSRAAARVLAALEGS
jgi:hypothetical protein